MSIRAVRYVKSLASARVNAQVASVLVHHQPTGNLPLFRQNSTVVVTSINAACEIPRVDAQYLGVSGASREGEFLRAPGEWSISCGKQVRSTFVSGGIDEKPQASLHGLVAMNRNARRPKKVSKGNPPPKFSNLPLPPNVSKSFAVKGF